MPECKNDGILLLNLKKLLILHLVWKTNWILQYGSLFFIMQLILVRIWRDNLPKYGRAITKFFLGIVLISFRLLHFTLLKKFVNRIPTYTWLV